MMQSSLTSRGGSKMQQFLPTLSSTATIGRQKKTGCHGKNNYSFTIRVATFAAVVWIICIMLWAQSLLSGNEDKNVEVAAIHEKLSVSGNDISLSSIIDMQPDDSEDTGFYEMLQSCDPTKPENKCQQNIPEGTTTHRVGILSPPGELSDFFANWVKDVIKVHSTEKTDIALIPTNHVPPYGYGKNHGWTKIIRFTSLPLGLASADALRSASHDDSSSDAMLSDLKAATRQIIRWHNRLSHVAAHTSLLTVSLDDLLDDPFGVEDKICNFLSVEKVVSGGSHIDEEELIGSVQPIIDLNNRLLTEIGHASGLEKAIEDVFEVVMKEEFHRSKNLSAWPCQSFWSVEDDPNPTKNLSPVIKKLAKRMSPNCNAEYTKCTVEKDRCEERGDAVCKH